MLRPGLRRGLARAGRRSASGATRCSSPVARADDSAESSLNLPRSVDRFMIRSYPTGSNVFRPRRFRHERGTARRRCKAGGLSSRCNTAARRGSTAWVGKYLRPVVRRPRSKSRDYPERRACRGALFEPPRGSGWREHTNAVITTHRSPRHGVRGSMARGTVVVRLRAGQRLRRRARFGRVAGRQRQAS